jgi:Sec-independent protein translocase protein TatA
MSAPVQERSSRWLNAAGVWDIAWMPPEGQHPWPELAELRAEHVRLRTAVSECGRKVGQIESELETLQQERQEVLRDSYRTGKEPKPSKQERERRRKLEAELKTAQEHAQAAMSVFLEFLDEATATISIRREQWLGDLARVEAERQAEVDELERKLRDARAGLGATARLTHWVDRTSGRVDRSTGELHPPNMMDHIAYAAIPIPAPQDNALSALSPEVDAWQRNHMRESLGVPANGAEPHAPADEDAKEALHEAMLRDIERQEQDEIKRGLRNA